MKIVILDTWCIDLFYNHTHIDFQNEIQDLEANWYIISTTMFNYGERLSWIKKYSYQKKINSQENEFSIHCFYKFFDEKREILYPDKNTSNFYAEIRCWLKNILKLSSWEIKCLHNDIWIASIGIQYNAIIYTTNKNDFEKMKEVHPSILFKFINKNL